MTPYAVQAQKKEICEILLKCPRVDVNLTNNNDEDLHHMAVDTDNSEILEMVEDCPRFIDDDDDDDDDDDEYEDEDEDEDDGDDQDNDLDVACRLRGSLHPPLLCCRHKQGRHLFSSSS